VLVVSNLGLSNLLTHTVKETNIQALITATLSTNMYLCMSKYRYIILRDILKDRTGKLRFLCLRLNLL